MKIAQSSSLERSIRVAVIGAALVPAAILAFAGGLLAFRQISEQEVARKTQILEAASAALDQELATLVERAGALALDSDLARATQVPIFISEADSRLDEFSRENPEVSAAALLAPDLKWVTSYPPLHEAGMLSGTDPLLNGCVGAASSHRAAFFPLIEYLGVFVPIRRGHLSLPVSRDSANGALCLELSWKTVLARAAPSGIGRIMAIHWNGKIIQGPLAPTENMTVLTAHLRDSGHFFGPASPELQIDTGPGPLDPHMKGRLLGLAFTLLSVLLLIGWGTTRLSRSIVAPIAQATALVRHFARGDYHYRPEPAPFAELNELAGTLSRMGDVILAQIEREKESNRAELDALKNQLKPHFLFNSLNGIASAAHVDPSRAVPMIQRLADLYRRILECSKRLQQPIADELALIENYLALEKERFGERLRYSIEADRSVTDFPVPCLLLQTLVENCVKHGIAKSLEGGEIRIRVEPAGEGRARVLIENTGEELALTYRPGTGLANTLRRLELANAGKHNFSLERTPTGRTRVSFELHAGNPLKEPTERIL